MGLAASTGRNNYELVDKLKESDLIHDDEVERVLRLVDRGRFFPADARHMAYRDVAWKSEQGDPGRLHISAPCIYANVLDHLHIAKGNSFLNIGSGTGYLSTVVGFLLEDIRNERWSRAPSFSIATLQHACAQTIRRCVRTAMMPSYKIRIRKYNTSTTTNEASADSEQEPSLVIHRGSDGAIEREVHVYGEEMANIRRRPMLPFYPTPVVIEMQELMRRNPQNVAERRRLPQLNKVERLRNGTAQVIRGMHALGFEMEDSDPEDYADDAQLDETSERSEEIEPNRTDTRAEIDRHSDQQTQQERNDNNAQMSAISTTLGKRSRDGQESENTGAKRHNGEVQKHDSIEMNEDTPNNNNHETSKQANVVFDENMQNESVNGESDDNSEQNQRINQETSINNQTDNSGNEREVTTDNFGASARNADASDYSATAIHDAQRSYSVVESDGDEERESVNVDVSAVLLHRESMPHSVVDFSEEHMSADTSNNDAEEDDLRDEEEKFQMEDIKRFSVEFERRMEKLPLSKALIEYIKYLP
ncbi:unnamed protein product [Anisakis simplex]|uniref:Protein-L-isoaspartate O-methyltransferase domain-containing protein 1 n=1 Tax=Anisakis simplex TaxID=6269 RepID=A0A0M3JYC5_ANISI|nr:unnamed protein product [Anisakis simplex]